MEPREPVVTYNGEDRSEAKLRAGVARFFQSICFVSNTAIYATHSVTTGSLGSIKFLTLTGVPRLRRFTPA